jgi:hypothetical protein
MAGVAVMMTKQDFLVLMVEAGNAYSTKVEKGQMSAYYDMLSQYPADALRQAFRDHIRSSEWFPKVSQIIALIEGSAKQKSADSWGRVLKEIRQTGSYGEPRVSPEIAEAIAKIGGWKHVCSLTHRELEFKSKDFAEVITSPANGIEYKPTTQRLN